MLAKEQIILLSENFIQGLPLSYSRHFRLCCRLSRTETCCRNYVLLDVRCRVGSTEESKVGLPEEQRKPSGHCHALTGSTNALSSGCVRSLLLIFSLICLGILSTVSCFATLLPSCSSSFGSSLLSWLPATLPSPVTDTCRCWPGFVPIYFHNKVIYVKVLRTSIPVMAFFSLFIGGFSMAFYLILQEVRTF